MDALLPVRPGEGVDGGEDLVGRCKEWGGRVGREVVEEDVQCDAVAIVVGRREGTEAAKQRGGAIVGQEFDEEGEPVGIRSRTRGYERRCGVGGAAEEDEEDT